MTTTMVDASAMLGWLSAALLFAAVAAWWKVRRSPMLQWLPRRRVPKDSAVENASRLLVIAVGASAVAAIVALGGLMFG